MNLDIKFVSHSDPILHELIAKLDQDLLTRYPIEDIYFVDFNDPSVERLGHHTIRLEAGEAQPEAVAFYTKCGYYPIACFGEYIGSKSSLCFEKKIG
ncbi:hypothetical protein [Paenibacillus qinlingensis]|uniref:Uncharacterized protein n=1 Tax=Paenibacillus qinlingensis TaxID=1837343 RepID=A0ABU1NQR5_9BACL|nr:hypothetical protein [Paenibacillus qinlingensis]MDR6549822.1 hypothetical protein [Paenibacillus qinlingensis]